MIHLTTAFLDARTAAALGTCSSHFTHLLASAPVWLHFENLHFPSPSFLTLKDELPPSCTRYAKRLTATRHQLQINYGVYRLIGETKDKAHSADGRRNVTKATAEITVKGFFFEGTVATEQGSLHNNPTTGTWQKGFFGAEKGALFNLSPQWQEKLPTSRGYYIYEGTLSRDGRTIAGSLSWSFLPKRVAGDFEFKVVAKLSSQASFQPEPNVTNAH